MYYYIVCKPKEHKIQAINLDDILEVVQTVKISISQL